LEFLLVGLVAFEQILALGSPYTGSAQSADVVNTYSAIQQR
jgi:hypothetical protein